MQVQVRVTQHKSKANKSKSVDRGKMHETGRGQTMYKLVNTTNPIVEVR